MRRRGDGVGIRRTFQEGKESERSGKKRKKDICCVSFLTSFLLKIITLLLIPLLLQILYNIQLRYWITKVAYYSGRRDKERKERS